MPISDRCSLKSGGRAWGDRLLWTGGIGVETEGERGKCKGPGVDRGWLEFGEREGIRGKVGAGRGQIG